MTALVSPRARNIDAALAIIRIIVGIVFFVHGYQKVFQFGFAGVSGFFAKAGIPLPGLSGPFIALLELLGGLALMLGVATRVVAALFAIEMVVAVLLVHLKQGFFAPMGFEYPLTLCLASVALALAGPGAYSVDGMIAGRRAAPSVAAANRI